MADGAAIEHEIDCERVSERRVVVPQTEGRERQEERGGDEQAEQERAAVHEQSGRAQRKNDQVRVASAGTAADLAAEWRWASVMSFSMVGSGRTTINI